MTQVRNVRNFYLNEIYARPRAPLYLKLWLLDWKYSKINEVGQISHVPHLFMFTNNMRNDEINEELRDQRNLLHFHFEKRKKQNKRGGKMDANTACRDPHHIIRHIVYLPKHSHQVVA